MDPDAIQMYEGKVLADLYVHARPPYPTALVDKIMKYASSNQVGKKTQKFSRMLDVACGSGQATRLFAPYFDSVLGIDISADQIEVGRQVTKETNVTYQLGSAHAFPVEDESVDYVNCGTAAHWFNFPKFISECERVLKPGGCVAIYLHNPSAIRTPGTTPHPNPEEWDPEWLKLWTSWFPALEAGPEYEITLQDYRPLYEQIPNDTKTWIKGIFYELEWNMDQCRKFFTSLGQYFMFMKDHDDPLDDYMAKFKKFLGVENKSEDEIRVIFTWYFPTIVFRKS